MSGFEFLGPQGLQDHPIVGPIVKELEEPEGQTFVVANLKPPTTEEPEITTFRVGDRFYTAWKKPGTEVPGFFGTSCSIRNFEARDETA